MTYISRFSDIGLYLEDYLMYKAVTLAGGIHRPCSLALVFSAIHKIPTRVFQRGCGLHILPFLVRLSLRVGDFFMLHVPVLNGLQGFGWLVD